VSGIGDAGPKTSKAVSDVSKTVHQLQRAVEALPMTDHRTALVCSHLESLNSRVFHDAGKFHNAAAAAYVQSFRRFVSLGFIFVVSV